MLNKVSRHLEVIQANLPTWFAMKKDNDTIGARFLNVFGLRLDDVEDLLNYIYEQRFIDTADIGQVDVIYKASIPANLSKDRKVEFFSEYYEMHKADDLEDFMRNIERSNILHGEVYHQNPYYVDYERRLVYVRKPYDADTSDYKEGKIKMKIYSSEGHLETTSILPLHLHHVWNFFDEFGLLLNVGRLYGEKNIDYKKRILDVFKRPGSSAMDGLYNGIARELGLVKERIWRDGSKKFMIKDARVKLGTIRVDDEPWLEALTEIDASGRLILHGSLTYEGVERTVSYIHGITMNELADKRDLAFQDILFDIDGRAKGMLQYYVDIITNKVPVMWNQFLWGVGFWDISDENISGFGRIPTFYDADYRDWLREEDYVAPPIPVSPIPPDYIEGIYDSGHIEIPNYGMHMNTMASPSKRFIKSAYIELFDADRGRWYPGPGLVVTLNDANPFYDVTDNSGFALHLAPIRLEFSQDRLSIHLTYENICSRRHGPGVDHYVTYGYKITFNYQ